MPAGIYPRTQEHNKAIGAALTGRALSQEHRAALRLSLKGRKASLEARGKMSKAVKVSHITHGMTDPRTYSSWECMKARCLNPRNSRYHAYGGRGIIVCDRWLRFENFYADMGDRPPGLTLDRIDNDSNYEPGNCRWATASEQQHNRRDNR